MTLAIASPVGQRRQLGWGLAWAAAFAVSLGLYLLRDRFPWVATYPIDLDHAGRRAGSAPPWGRRPICSSASRAASPPCSPCRCDFALDLLSQGFQFGDGAIAVNLPRLSWVGVTAAVAIAGHALGGRQAGAGHRALLPLPRPVRPVGQRHADAGADRRRRAARRRLGLFLGIWATAIPASTARSSSRCSTSPRRRRTSPISCRC